MARFRAVIRGQRGEASRLGSEVSGISASVNGWDSGVTVRAVDVGGQDVFEIYVTGGSNGGQSSKYIGNVGTLGGAVKFFSVDGED